MTDQTNKKLAVLLRKYAKDSGYSHADYADAMRQAAKAIDALAADRPIEEAERRILASIDAQGDDAWQKLFWRVASALKCLPSSFADGNEHVIKAALSASAPAAGSGPSDADLIALAKKEVPAFAEWPASCVAYARALLAQYGSAARSEGDSDQTIAYMSGFNDGRKSVRSEADLEIIEAARNLVKVKGRHHGELAYKRLADAVASAPLVAPITEIVNKHGEV